MTNVEKIIKMMSSMASPGGAPVWIPELRSKFKAEKPVFDRAVLAAASTGRLFLQRHAYPCGLLNDAEKQSFIPDTESDGRLYYCAVALRKEAHQ